MEVTRDRKLKHLTFHQRKCIKDVLDLFSMQDALSSAFPAAPGVRLTKTDTAESAAPSVDATYYRWGTGVSNDSY